jgi:hypothetical protein
VATLLLLLNALFQPKYQLMLKRNYKNILTLLALKQAALMALSPVFSRSFWDKITNFFRL